MNWEAVGAVGEILGATAVVATLVYLAIQVRYAKNAAADVNRLSRAVGVRETISKTVADSALADAWMRSEGSLGHYETLAEKMSLTVAEAYKVEQHCQVWWWLHWGQWASITTERDQDELKHLISEFYSVPPMSIAWTNSQNVRLLDPGFQKFVTEEGLILSFI